MSKQIEALAIKTAADNGLPRPFTWTYNGNRTWVTYGTDHPEDDRLTALQTIQDALAPTVQNPSYILDRRGVAGYPDGLYLIFERMPARRGWRRR